MSKTEMNCVIRKFGIHAGIRYLKNHGVSFEDAYHAAFGKKPRI